MTFLLAPKRKRLIFFCIESLCPKYTFSLPDSGNCYFFVFQNAHIWTLLAPGNWASAYVAPCHVQLDPSKINNKHFIFSLYHIYFSFPFPLGPGTAFACTLLCTGTTTMYSRLYLYPIPYKAITWISAYRIRNNGCYCISLQRDLVKKRW